MESFKRPEMIIAIIVLIALIAITIFFYRKLGSQQEEINKYGERLAGVVKKISEMPQQTHITQLVEGVKARDDTISEQVKVIKSLTNEVEEMRYLVDTMVDHMNDMGHKVRLPRNFGGKSKSGKSVSFRSKKEKEREDSETEQEPSETEEEERPRGRSKVADKEEDALEKKIALARAHRQGH